MATKKTEKKAYSTFAILFFINKNKIKKNGLCPLMGRISVNAKMVQFSTKMDIDPKQWNAKKYRLNGSGSDVLKVNLKLDKLTAEITEHYNELVINHGFVTAELVKNRLNGIGNKKTMLIELFDEHNEEYKEKVGVNRCYSTYCRYLFVRNHVKNFILWEYGEEDIRLRSLTLTFIEKFDLYLRSEYKMAEGTISAYTILLRKIVCRAISQGTLIGNPFAEYIPKQVPKKCKHLTQEELDKMMQTPLSHKALRKTRDLFVFSTFTGIAYVDLCKLSTDNLEIKEDGSWWLHFTRQKTGSECHLRLLDMAISIIKKYEEQRTSDKLFDIGKYNEINISLKRVAKRCGMDRNITYHMSRHNFASLITLSQGVPIETVSQMMGHSGLRTTQIYAKMLDKKVKEDIVALADEMKGKFSVFNDENYSTDKIIRK